MQHSLDVVELRVLGCLMEKELATPEYYPLSLNALINACNQKTNRAPVLSLDEQAVGAAVQSLKERRIIYQSDANRVPKYWQAFSKEHDLGTRESALLAVLLLRGPQTTGELRGRADSMCPFESLEQVTASLDHLVTAGLAVQLSRQPGQKEQRYVHLLAVDTMAMEEPAPPHHTVSGVRTQGEDRMAVLEQTVSALREELAQLKSDFLAFKQHFE
jgi:uncharacterized protein